MHCIGRLAGVATRSLTQTVVQSRITSTAVLLHPRNSGNIIFSRLFTCKPEDATKDKNTHKPDAQEQDPTEDDFVEEQINAFVTSGNDRGPHHYNLIDDSAPLASFMSTKTLRQGVTKSENGVFVDPDIDDLPDDKSTSSDQFDEEFPLHNAPMESAVARLEREWHCSAKGKGSSAESRSLNLTPDEIVQALDEHVIGQYDAKRAVAIALRSRWRRLQLKEEDLQRETRPANILMIGPTGSGKTEIIRRLARLADAPFVRVEATRYTEVGVVGANTDQMIKDLVEVAFKSQIEIEVKKHLAGGLRVAQDIIIGLLRNRWHTHASSSPSFSNDAEPTEASNGQDGPASSASLNTRSHPSQGFVSSSTTPNSSRQAHTLNPKDPFVAMLLRCGLPPRAANHASYNNMLKWLRAGIFDNEVVELDLPKQPPILMPPAQGGPGALSMIPIITSTGPGEGIDGGAILAGNVSDLLSRSSGDSRRTRRSLSNLKKFTVSEALEKLAKLEAYKLIDIEEAKANAIKRVEEMGIIFIDEIDKLAEDPQVTQARGSSIQKGLGVQKELLSLLEGTTIQTPRGPIRTQHILFIAGGAFYRVKPHNLLPELQGRLPLQVKLSQLSKEEYFRVLTEPKFSQVKIQKHLLLTEGMDLEFTKEALEEIARVCSLANTYDENLGARRLQALLSAILEELSFEAPRRRREFLQKWQAENPTQSIASAPLLRYSISAEEVRTKLARYLERADLSKFTL